MRQAIAHGPLPSNDFLFLLHNSTTRTARAEKEVLNPIALEAELVADLTALERLVSGRQSDYDSGRNREYLHEAETTESSDPPNEALFCEMSYFALLWVMRERNIRQSLLYHNVTVMGP
jgi:hypothetical protein